MCRTLGQVWPTSSRICCPPVPEPTIWRQPQPRLLDPGPSVAEPKQKLTNIGPHVTDSDPNLPTVALSSLRCAHLRGHPSQTSKPFQYSHAAALRVHPGGARAAPARRLSNVPSGALEALERGARATPRMAPERRPERQAPGDEASRQGGCRARATARIATEPPGGDLRCYALLPLCDVRCPSAGEAERQGKGSMWPNTADVGRISADSRLPRQLVDNCCTQV